MELKIESPKEAFIGQPLNVRAIVELDQNTEVNYSGIVFHAIRPCDRPLLIEQKEIFCKGIFEQASYIRTLSIPVPSKIVPSSERRGVKYGIKLYVRAPQDGGVADQDQEFSTETLVSISEFHDPNKILEVNPIVLAIKGLKLSLQKDVYRPSETIKISFEAKDMKDLKILLMQKSNILCNCTQYGRVCTQVPVIPPSAAGAAKANNPTTGFVLITVPASAELSARHSWEPKEQSTWSDKFGDYNEWCLSVTGTKYNGENVTFEIPIEIDVGRISTEKRPEVDFFERAVEMLEPRTDGSSPFQIKKVLIESLERSNNHVVIQVKNGTKTILNGCTCRITGIKDMFFETKPFMVGFGRLNPDESKSLYPIPVSQGVNSINIEMASNEGPLGSFKKEI